MRAVLIVPLLLSATPILAQLHEPVDVVLKDDRDSISYAVGVNLGTYALKDSIVLNPDAVAEGVRDALDMATARLNEQQVQRIVQQFQEKLMAKAQAQIERGAATDSVDAIANGAAGENFLARNKSNPGVKTLPGGVQYKVIKEGTGPQPTMSDSIVVAYTGKLINGKIFDSSLEFGEPLTFSLDDVMPGWAQALVMMNVGSKWEVYIPPSAGYGSERSGDVPANSTLIFEVELLDIKR